jgi:hypothetical protein
MATDEDDDSGMSSGTIILIVILVIFFLLLIIFAFVFFFRSPNNNNITPINGNCNCPPGLPGPQGPQGPPGDSFGTGTLTQTFDITTPSSGNGTIEIPITAGFGQLFNINYLAGLSVPNTLLGGAPTIYTSSGPNSNNQVAFDSEFVNSRFILHIYHSPPNTPMVLTIVFFFEELAVGIQPNVNETFNITVNNPRIGTGAINSRIPRRSNYRRQGRRF